MSGMRWELAPYSEPWQGQQQRNTTSRFRSDWATTIRLMAAETEHLDAGLVVVEVDTPLANLSRDRQQFREGQPRTPGVRVCFDSKHGLQRHATGAFSTWRHNVHAVALSLQALRQIDRFGVSNGAQYVGFRPALEAGSKPAFDNAREAIHWLTEQGRGQGLQGEPAYLYRQLAKAWHSDSGRDPDGNWGRLQAAHLVLEAAGVL